MQLIGRGVCARRAADAGALHGAGAVASVNFVACSSRMAASCVLGCSWLEWRALVLWTLLAVTRQQGIVAQQELSSSAGLNGKIIGLGNGYGGESHGRTKVFDGKTDTWFDCFGTDGIDIKSDCWVGLELPAPTSVDSIRFFPRGKCPGCQTGGNPACLEIQKEKGKCDEGACRMSGGKFQGALASTGPWHDLASVSTTSSVVEASWTSLSSTDSTPYTYVRYMSAPLGYCNVAEVEFYAPSVWGWTFVSGSLVVSAVYLFGGVAYGRKVRRAPVAGLAAHPHYAQFLAVQGLVMDGVTFARGRGRGTASRGAYRAVDDTGPSRADASNRSGTTSTEKPPKKTKQKEKKHRKQPHDATGGGSSANDKLISAPALASAREPAVAVTRASAAGDGGRWVHVPN